MNILFKSIAIERTNFVASLREGASTFLDIFFFEPPNKRRITSERELKKEIQRCHRRI
jgi:hypothetical protein